MNNFVFWMLFSEVDVLLGMPDYKVLEENFKEN